MFDPREFINVSRGLSASGLTEAQYRTAVSRALYGIFLWAREELERRDQHVKSTAVGRKGDEHGNVRQRFLSGPFKHGGVHQRLGSLYRLRGKSDYELDTTVRRADVLQALDHVAYIEKHFERTFS